MNESEGTNDRLSRPAPDTEALRFRAWPCARCRQGLTPIRYLINCQSADPAFRSRSIDEKLVKEVVWLQEWVTSCPHGEKQFPVAKLTHGSEHNVYLEQEFRECVIKSTLPGLYGDRYYLKEGIVYQQACTPYEYLVRLRLWKKIFGFAPWAVGISAVGEIISMQTFVLGDEPTQEQVNEFLRQSGLTAVRETCWLWKQDDAAKPVSIWVGDARSDNFVAHEGQIIPIDLRLWITPSVRV